jgi:alpha-tubulin suppressor-like RCC1 family protein
VQSISAGVAHTCAVLKTGVLQCWGDNGAGQLGISGSNTHTPATVLNGVSTIATGTYHTCAVLTTGGMRCWGDNGLGQLGDLPAGTGRTTPGNTDVLTAVSYGAASFKGTCAITNGGVRCWGGGHNGELGNGTSTDIQPTPPTNPVLLGATAISMGEYHVCALLGTGEARCWGSDAFSQLGDTPPGGTRPGDKRTTPDPSSPYNGARFCP